MACCNPIFGDLQENLQIINLTIPLHDYLRHKAILIHITRRNIRFKRLTELLSKAGNDDDIEFDEDFKMPREVLLRPETCIISNFNSDGLFLRLETARSVFSYFKPNETMHTATWNQVTKAERDWISSQCPVFCCGSCLQPITIDKPIRRVLELPSDNWYELFESSAWCHNHSHSSTTSSMTSSSVPKVRMAPKSGDCLTSDFAYLFKLDQIDIEGIRIGPRQNKYVEAYRNVQMSQVLCSRCQHFIGFIFWDMDHSTLESERNSSKALEHKEYVKLYKHNLACREAINEEEVDFLGASSQEKKKQPSMSPFIGDLLSEDATFETLFAQYFRHQAQESFYRFLVVCDDPGATDSHEVSGLIRLLSVNSKIVLSKESVSLPAGINGYMRKNSEIEDFAIVRLSYLEKPAVKSTPHCNIHDFERATQRWEKEIIGVSRLLLSRDLIWRLFAILTSNTAHLPQQSRVDKSGEGDSKQVSKIGFLKLNQLP
ncbi:uncharacterized protein LOC134845899 isoform X1 [Symsagittifera roscoffensis]|uniref:uncharacterized protein LOC134845899 isoform X1 n=2 Tax=Symsagittifera roscoffensis TaxID=84072 RepID=UPI00307BCFCE